MDLLLGKIIKRNRKAIGKPGEEKQEKDICWPNAVEKIKIYATVLLSSPDEAKASNIYWNLVPWIRTTI